MDDASVGGTVNSQGNYDQSSVCAVITARMAPWVMECYLCSGDYYKIIVTPFKCNY